MRRCSTFSVSPERPRIVAQPLVGLCGLVCCLAAPKDLRSGGEDSGQWILECDDDDDDDDDDAGGGGGGGGGESL